MKYLLPLLVFSLFMSGCCSKTTLILLPDDSGETGQAFLQTDTGSVTVDKPYTFSSVSSSTAQPTSVRSIEPEEVKAQYGEILDAEPATPQYFLLYFHSGGSVLTSESEQILNDVVTAINQDMPVEVDIIGHSDTLGNKEDNYRLSLKRAEAIQKLLLYLMPDIKSLTTHSYGENVLLVPTPDNVAEPKNRRVEIFVR